MADTNDQLLSIIGKLIDEKLEPIKKQLENVELKVAAIQAVNKKDHNEIMDKLFVMSDADGQEQKRLEKRIERIKKHLSLNHSNNPLPHSHVFLRRKSTIVRPVRNHKSAKPPFKAMHYSLYLSYVILLSKNYILGVTDGRPPSSRN